MWKFSKAAGWEEIEDFLQRPDVNDCDTELELAGYPVTGALFGSEHCGFYVRVLTGSTNAKFRYLVDTVVNDTIEFVAVPSFPDLVELLSKLAPIAEASAVALERSEKEDKEVARVGRESQ